MKKKELENNLKAMAKIMYEKNERIAKLEAALRVRNKLLSDIFNGRLVVTQCTETPEVIDPDGLLTIADEKFLKENGIIY